MNRLAKFLRLPTEDRRLLIQTALLAQGIQAALFFLSFKTVQRLASPKDSAKNREPSAHSLSKIRWAVHTVCRHLPPRKNCLVQSLTAETLLDRLGYPASFQIGVAKDEMGHLTAHAWVTSRGEMVTGRPSPAGFSPLIILENKGMNGNGS